MNKLRLFGDITKMDQQEDGSIIVEGFASSEVLDSDGEIITAEAMKTALPEYMQFANIREMHQPSAVGVALEATVDDATAKTFIRVRVVDESAIKKCLTGVYKGFSVAGKVTDRLGKVIKGLKLREISLVDRPANPEALFTLGKVEGGEDDDNKAAADVGTDPKGDVAKGAYTVMTLVDMMRGLKACCGEIKWEVENEGMSQALKDEADALMASLGAFFLTYSQAFVAEMTTKLSATGDLEKKGARFSKGTKAMLKGIHDKLRECEKSMSDMGYESAEEDEEADKGASSGDLAKLQSANEELTNGVELRNVLIDQIGKAMGAKFDKADPIEKVAAAIAKQVGEVLATPLSRPPVRDLGESNVVEKSQAPEVGTVTTPDGAVNEVATEIKKAQLTPVTMYGFRQ